MEQKYFKNAKLWYIIIFGSIAVYYLNREFQLLSAVTNHSKNLIEPYISFDGIWALREGNERIWNVGLSMALLLLIFFTKNAWVDFKLKRNQMRMNESIAQRRQKKNSLDKISKEEFEFQSNQYTHEQLQKLY
jgi:cytochrome c biogenesis factor